jgi:hypothetical protein
MRPWTAMALFCQGADHHGGEIWDLVARHRPPRAERTCQACVMPLRDVDAELGQKARIMLTSWVRWRTRRSRRPMQSERSLLFDRLDRDEAHRRSGHSLADRLGVGLAALYVRLDVGRRHQPHLVT